MSHDIERAKRTKVKGLHPYKLNVQDQDFEITKKHDNLKGTVNGTQCQQIKYVVRFCTNKVGLTSNTAPEIICATSVNLLQFPL